MCEHGEQERGWEVLIELLADILGELRALRQAVDHLAEVVGYAGDATCRLAGDMEVIADVCLRIEEHTSAVRHIVECVGDGTVDALSAQR